MNKIFLLFTLLPFCHAAEQLPEEPADKTQHVAVDVEVPNGNLRHRRGEERESTICDKVITCGMMSGLGGLIVGGSVMDIVALGTYGAYSSGGNANLAIAAGTITTVSAGWSLIAAYCNSMIITEETQRSESCCKTSRAQMQNVINTIFHIIVPILIFTQLNNHNIRAEDAVIGMLIFNFFYDASSIFDGVCRPFRFI